MVQWKDSIRMIGLASSLKTSTGSQMLSSMKTICKHLVIQRKTIVSDIGCDGRTAKKNTPRSMCNFFTSWVLVQQLLIASLWNPLCVHENGYVWTALQLDVVWLNYVQQLSDRHSWQTPYAFATCWVWTHENQYVIDQLQSYSADALLSIASRCIDTVVCTLQFYETVFQTTIDWKVVCFLVFQDSC